MTFDDITRRLDAKPSGSAYKAHCPCHKDATPSLSLSEGSDGRTLIKCLAGCDTREVVERLGLSMKDLFANQKGNGNGNGQRPRRAPIIKVYDYKERGSLRYQVCRREDKTFSQRRPDGKGGWIWNVKGIKRVPYRLDDLQGQSRVYVAEGEKDVDRLWNVGLAATCNPGGASKCHERPKWTNDLSTLVRAAGVSEVVCLPDNDDPGRAHMDAVARSCTAAGIEVRIVPLPNVPEKGDVSDYFDAGHTAADLLGLCEAATVYVPTEKPEAYVEASVSVVDFYAYMPTHSYLFIPSREFWPASSVNARVAPLDCGTDEVKGKPPSMSANVWLDRNRAVEQMTWAPGLPMLISDRLISDGGWIERRDCSCVNLYRPPQIIPGNPESADAWLDLVRIVYPADADHIIAWLAHRVQRPQDKVNHALVLGGAPGIGKDTILDPVKTAIGPWNFAEVSPAHLLGRFNGFVKSVILRVSEARDLGEMNRYDFYEHMKVYTAAPPDVLRVDEKNIREYSVFNVCGVVITTNHETDGIYLPPDDRRHYVTWSALTPEDFDEGYWKHLWAWYDSGGRSHVAAYLVNYDLSKFDAKAPPPKTEAFWAVVDANRSTEDAELADVLDEADNPHAVTLRLLADIAAPSLANWLRDRKNARQIPHRLKTAGYVPYRNPAAKDGLWKIEGVRQVIYVLSELSVPERQREAERLTRPVEGVGEVSDLGL